MADRRELKCPLCQSSDFEKQEGKMDSKWGFTAHKITLMICKNCRFLKGTQHLGLRLISAIRKT